MTTHTFAQLSNRELLDQLARAVAEERHATADVVALLAEVDARRLYLPEGCKSLFTYCTDVLRFTEQESYHRIQAARAAREYPQLLDKLRNGSLTLTSVTLISRHLTPDNAERLINVALNKSTRAVEELMAAIDPKPDVKATVRKLSTATLATDRLSQPVTAEKSAPTVAPPPPQATPLPDATPRSISAPLSADRYLLRVTLSAASHAKLRRAQDLLRHSVPNGDPAVIVERALALLVDDLERRRLANVAKPRVRPRDDRGSGPSAAKAAPSRHVPAAVRREVWARDAGRCAFVGRQGRCRETGHLEFHHIHAFALGGPTTAANLELRCRAHNQYEGALLFGPDARSSPDDATQSPPR